MQPDTISLYGEKKCTGIAGGKSAVVSLPLPLPQQEVMWNGAPDCQNVDVSYSVASAPPTAIPLDVLSNAPEPISIEEKQYNRWIVSTRDRRHKEQCCLDFGVTPRYEYGRRWWGYPAIVVGLPFALVGDIFVGLALLIDPPKRAPGL